MTIAQLWRWRVSSMLLAWGVLSASQPLAHHTPDTLAELKQLSLEELLNVEVTIAGQSPQAVRNAPAAVYVITQADIQRMGATTIPEALRLVPGLRVARMDVNKWAIGVRGSTFLFTNKLLVMMDGRTLYNPLFSGVQWEGQDTLLADVERIEVVRGPGAATWGSNAVNGVINIITRHASDTQGVRLSGTLGTEQGLVRARYGGHVSAETQYRVYGQYRHFDNAVFSDGSKATDSHQDLRGGFRLDWRAASGRDSVLLSGDGYQGNSGTRVQRVIRDAPFSTLDDHTSRMWGAHLLGRWTHQGAEGSRHRLQLYYDHRFSDSWLLKNLLRGTFDLDYQYHTVWRRHTLVLGGGYRYQHDKVSNTDFYGLNPDRRQTHLFSLYWQDDMELWKDTLWLTLGSRFEHNDYSGFEVQPSVRVRWQVDEKQMVWAAVSRAVRIPSRWEQDAERITDGLLVPNNPLAGALTGNPDFQSENLLAFDLGYRIQLNSALNLDVSLFYNRYERLGNFRPTGLVSPAELTPVSVLQAQPDNSMNGETYGVEVSLDWQPVERWSLRLAYTYLDVQFRQSTDAGQLLSYPVDASYEGAPEQQLSGLSSYRFAPEWSFQVFARYLDQAPVIQVDDFIDLDLGLRWEPHRQWALSLYGRNLLQSQHQEFDQVAVAPVATEVQRSVYLQLDWRF